MQILKRIVDTKNKNGFVEIIPQTNDDIYTLYNAIDLGDRIKSSTTRKYKIHENADAKKIITVLEIVVETIDVDLEAGCLFLKGKVCSENQYVPLNCFHTLTIEKGQRLKISKRIWTALSLKSLETLEDQTCLLVIFVLSKATLFCEVTQNFVSTKRRFDSKQDKKKLISRELGNFNFAKYEAVVVAGKDDLLNDFTKALADSKNFKSSKLKFLKGELDREYETPTKMVSILLSDPSLSNQLIKCKFVDELHEAKFFLDNISNSDLVAVGIAGVQEALDFGAVKTLLVTNIVFKSYDVQVRKEIEEMCKVARCSGAKICIVPVKHFYGEKIQDLGGVCCLLKFKYKFDSD